MPPSTRVDALDLAIIREIGIEPFAGRSRDARPWRPEVLARGLKASPRLVKDRVARLERDGLIAGYDIQPNLALLGVRSRTYAFTFPTRADRRATLDGVAKLDGVCGYVDYVSDWTTVTIVYRDEAEHERRLADVRAALGGATPETWFESYAPDVDRTPTPLDWRILRALRGDAKRPMHEIADGLSISAKTLQRHLDRLAKEGAFATFARLSDKVLDEFLLCSVVFRIDEARVGPAMEEIHGALLTDTWTRCSAPMLQDGVHYDLVAAPRSPRALAELLERAARVPGVVDVRGHLATRAVFTLAPIDAELARMVDA